MLKKYDEYTPEQYHDREATFYAKVSKKSYEERYKEHKQKNYEWQKKTNSFSFKEIQDAFWNHLSKQGWKFYERATEKYLVLSCLICDTIISQVVVSEISPTQLREMSNPRITQVKMDSHNHVCKAIPKG